jgi:hypothetical protein
MKQENLEIQDLSEPEILKPTRYHRTSFRRGWHDVVLRGSQPVTIGDQKVTWRQEGRRAAVAFREIMPELTEGFIHAVFLWSVNQRRLTVGLNRLERLADE